ncbi:TatD DNase family protein [Nematocida displodere]|uniref:TatD DNase family protein n=1 Tax=Nematocida displodere TaxID=1805483 RepID=A0A177EEX9_9MICR|nr:TatD DNase family protein [Nematocida displodere]
MPYDIAVNITDAQYSGEYYQKKKHPLDIPSVMTRAKAAGVHMLFLGLSLQSSIESIYLSNVFKEHASIGVHPGSTLQCTDGDVEQIADILQKKSISKYRSLIREEIRELSEGATLEDREAGLYAAAPIAIGEVGLDYFREYSTKSQQKKVFRQMMDLSLGSSLPYIFHYRECERDFLEITSDYSVSGVVHSFTGMPEEMHALIRKNYYIGINGASIRENELTSVIEELPLEKLLVETDSPYCAIKKTSQYYPYTKEYLPQTKSWTPATGVKGRNEPANLFQVLDVISEIKNIPKNELINITNKNWSSLFGRPPHSPSNN